MKKKNMLTLALAVTALLSASAVLASEVKEADVEEIYGIICVPGSEKNLPEDKKEEALAGRESFHEFLRDPSQLLFRYEFAMLDPGPGALGAVIEASVTCAALDALKGRISERGCKDGEGKPSSVEAAVGICAELTEKMDAKPAAKRKVLSL